MRSVGSILQSYDTDQKFPLYGFGAKLPDLQKPSHCFALNGDIFKPEVNGIQGLVNGYKNAISKCALYGPTNFESIISYVNGFCGHKDKLQS